MTTYKLPFVRFVKQGTTPPMSVLSTAAAAINAESDMIDSAWREVQAPVASWPVRNANQNGFSDRYDASKYVGNYADGMHRGYATMAAYRHAIPIDAFTGTPAEITSVIVSLHVDRWLTNGARVAVYLSDDPAPSESYDYNRSGIAVASAQLLPVTPAADQSLDLNIDLPANTEVQKYLYVVITLENYQTVRGFWMEGGAILVGSVTRATFSRALNLSAGTVLPLLATSKYRLADQTITGPVEQAEVSGLDIPADEPIEQNWQRWDGALRMFSAAEKTVTQVVAGDQEPPWQQLKFQIRYGGANASGSTIRINVFENNLMHETPACVGTINKPSSFPAVASMSIIAGSLTAGTRWFWVFVDNNGNGEYEPGLNMPAGMAKAVVGPDITAPIQVHLFDVAPTGYVRTKWAANASREYAIAVAAVANTTPATLSNIMVRDGASGRPKIIGREYAHEGDYIAHTENGYAPAANHLNGMDIISNPLAQYGYSANNPAYQHNDAHGGTAIRKPRGTPYEALTTPSVEMPSGTITDTRLPLVRWNSGSIDKFSTFDLQIRRTSDSVVVIDLANLRYPVRASSKYEYTVEASLPDAAYEVRVRTHSPDITPRFSSAWSSWAAFTIAYAPPAGSTFTLLAGLSKTSQTQASSYGWSTICRGHAHVPRRVKRLRFPAPIPATRPVMIRLAVYLEINPPWREGGTPENNSYYGDHGLDVTGWTNSDLWRGVASSIKLTGTPHGDSLATVTPLLVVDLDPSGYNASHPFAIDAEIAGPFNLYFFASPIALQWELLSNPGSVNTPLGLLDWTPTVVTLD